MKAINLITFLLLGSTFLFSACEKSNDYQEEFTAEDYYVKATVNGEEFEANFYNITTFSGYDSTTKDSISGFSANHNQTALQVDILLSKQNGSYTINRTTNRYPNANFINYQKGPENSDIYYTPNAFNWTNPTSEKIGEININRNDEQVFAGTFFYTAYNNQGNAVKIENGKFQILKNFTPDE
ncbi:MAG: hypothetical protein ACEPOZ_18005 [Marinifilaceae bacterium]